VTWTVACLTSANAVTMHSVRSASVKKDSLYAMMFGCRSFDSSCAS